VVSTILDRVALSSSNRGVIAGSRVSEPSSHGAPAGNCEVFESSANGA
jgi:hypothetical protein